MSDTFKNRVFGFSVIKAINSNFNADFTGQPRTLPDGRVYATDKALKYSVRNYLVQNYPGEKILYYRRIKEEGSPLSLAEAYEAVTAPGSFDKDHSDKSKVLTNVLSCLDVRLFGSTFAPKKGKNKVNLSVHGPVQINHALNQFYDGAEQKNDMYSEQITAPFRNDNSEEGKDKEDKQQTTIGRQSKLREGHYVYHFSVNPKNLQSLTKLAGGEITGLLSADIEKLKEALRNGVTYFDSASKAGSDNEALFWLQLKEDSKLVLPSFAEMVKIRRSDSGKVIIDMSPVSELIRSLDKSQIEKLELYLLPEATEIEGAPDGVKYYHLISESAVDAIKVAAKHIGEKAVVA